MFDFSQDGISGLFLFKDFDGNISQKDFSETVDKEKLDLRLVELSGVELGEHFDVDFEQDLNLVVVHEALSVGCLEGLDGLDAFLETVIQVLDGIL